MTGLIVLGVLAALWATVDYVLKHWDNTRRALEVDDALTVPFDDAADQAVAFGNDVTPVDLDGLADEVEFQRLLHPSVSNLAELDRHLDEWYGREWSQ